MDQKQGRQNTITDNIKNDLRRVSKWAVDLKNPLPDKQIEVFLLHAADEFKKLTTAKSHPLAEELQELWRNKPTNSNEVHKRVRWAEEILTLSCRL